MTTFVQLHFLTFYPPSNPNRDDTGRPKTARIGGAERLRISSQALKRAVRTSPVFLEAVDGKVGTRTQRLGDEIRKTLEAEGTEADAALKAAAAVAKVFGKPEENPDKPAFIRQLAFISPEEQAAATDVARRIAKGEEIDESDLGAKLLRRTDRAVDIAMFGRMLADAADFNREAAVQVAHAFTVDRVTVEDDYFTAVDDLKTAAEDAGAGMIGEVGFGSGVFYLYVCVDRDLLIRNLEGDAALADQAVAALVRTLAVVTPKGKIATFAHRARAGYVLAEKGSAQPRTLAGAFLKPVEGADVMGAAVTALERHRAKLDRAYGPAADAFVVMNVEDEAGKTLDDVAAFVRG